MLSYWTGSPSGGESPRRPYGSLRVPCWTARRGYTPHGVLHLGQPSSTEEPAFILRKPQRMRNTITSERKIQKKKPERTESIIPPPTMMDEAHITFPEGSFSMSCQLILRYLAGIKRNANSESTTGQNFKKTRPSMKPPPIIIVAIPLFALLLCALIHFPFP